MSDLDTGHTGEAHGRRDGLQRIARGSACLVVMGLAPTPLTLVGVFTETKIMSHSAMCFSGSAEKKRFRPRASNTICDQVTHVTETAGQTMGRAYRTTSTKFTKPIDCTYESHGAFFRVGRPAREWGTGCDSSPGSLTIGSSEPGLQSWPGPSHHFTHPRSKRKTIYRDTRAGHQTT